MKKLRYALVLGLLLNGGFLQALTDKEIVDRNRERVQREFEEEFNGKRELTPEKLVQFAALSADEKVPGDAKTHPQYEKFKAMTQAQRQAAARGFYEKFPDKKIAENLLMRENLSTQHKLMLAMTKLREYVSGKGGKQYPAMLRDLPAEVAREIPAEIEYLTTGENLKVHYIGGHPFGGVPVEEPIFWLELGAHRTQEGSGFVLMTSGKFRVVPKEEFTKLRKTLEAASAK